MKIGYIDNWNGATVKVEILDETVSGKCVLRKAPSEKTNIHGKRYLAIDVGGIFLQRKEDVKEI